MYQRAPSPRDEPEVRVKARRLLRLNDQLLARSEWALMGQWIWDSEAITEIIDKVTQLPHWNLVFASVLAKQCRLYELGPSDYAVSPRLGADHGAIGFASTFPPLKPIVERRRRNTEQASRLRLREHLPIEHTGHGISLAVHCDNLACRLKKPETETPH